MAARCLVPLLACVFLALAAQAGCGPVGAGGTGTGTGIGDNAAPPAAAIPAAMASNVPIDAAAPPATAARLDASIVDSGVDTASASDAPAAALQSLAANHCYKSGCNGFWERDPCNAFDGDLTTSTGPGKTWSGDQGNLAVDLGETRTIAKMVMRYRAGDKDPNPGYRIDVSDDGRTWRTARDVTKPAQEVDTQEGLNATGRYLRVFCKHYYFDPWWMRSVVEIEVWAVK